MQGIFDPYSRGHVSDFSHHDFTTLLEHTCDSSDQKTDYRRAETTASFSFDAGESMALVRERGRCVVALDAAVQKILSMKHAGSDFVEEGLNEPGKVIDHVKRHADSQQDFNDQVEALSDLALMACSDTADMLMAAIEDTSQGFSADKGNIEDQVLSNRSMAEDASLLFQHIAPALVKMRSALKLGEAPIAMPSIPVGLRGLIANAPAPDTLEARIEYDDVVTPFPRRS